MLYKARRIVYGVSGGDATRGSPDRIAMKRGLPGAGGVLSARGHVFVNDAKDSPRTAVSIDDHRLIATLVQRAVRATRAARPRVPVIQADACFLHPINPNDEIPPTGRHRSASRDPRRWLARICVRPVCRGRVPSRARTCQEGVPA